MSYTYSYSDDDFRTRLTEGHQVELRIASRIRAWGFDVQDPVFEFRGSTADVGRFTRGQSDLQAGAAVLEVKSRNIKFTSAQDFPYDDVIVESVHGFESKQRHPDLYLIHSKPTDALLVLDTRHKSQWTIKEAYDAARKLRGQSYFAPKHLFKPESYLEGYVSAMTV